MKIKKETSSKKERVYLTFLRRTKSGKYAKVNKNVLAYARLQTVGREPYFEEEGAYYYSRR